MRKLKLQVQITIDGYIAGPNSEMDWMTFPWNDDINAYVTAISEPMDTVLLGRKLAEGFIPHWASVAADPAHPEVEAGKIFVNTPKIVFSRTLDQIEWPNTTLAQGELSEVVNALKQQAGDDMMAYGGAEFVSSLIEANLIDEYHLFINPTAIGSGLRIFTGRTNLSFLHSQAFDNGIVVLVYGKRAE